MKFGNKLRVALSVPRPIAGILAAGLLALAAVPAQAAGDPVLSVTSGTNGCYALLAGQTIDAGVVCFVVNDNDTLDVTYATSDGWELTEAHLWVGEDQDGYPMAKNGNPKIGNFPYNSGNITGTTVYTFSVPLGNVQKFFDLGELGDSCGKAGTLYAMAHAAVRLVDGGGNVIQTETGWSEGEGAVQKGSWATRSAITLKVTCDDGPPPPPPTLGQETAMMFGNIVLNDGTDGICLEFVDTSKPKDGIADTWVDTFDSNRWGWQAGPLSTTGGVAANGVYVQEIWAAAGNNVLTKGTHVGDVTINVTDGNVTVTPVLFEGFGAKETHIYIGTTPVCSAAFGSDWKNTASTNVDTNGGVYVGVHLSVEAECQSNGNFCEAPK